MSNYPQAPPKYQPKVQQAGDEASRPLLGSPGPSSGPGAIFDQPDDDIPEDFKVSNPSMHGSFPGILKPELVRSDCLRQLSANSAGICEESVQYPM